jgi:queuine tRNA-ribosyltransferase
MFYKTIKQSSECGARAGIIHTDHGDIPTPIFMPVGTQASVKTLDTNDIKNTGAEIILANTYHLHLRPGEDLIDATGGLHKFMGWDGPILTDSGGFQVLSLGAQKTRNKGGEALSKIDDNGVTFKSHIDGSTHRFTPEIAVDIQHKLGADIIMAFDEATPDDADVTYAKGALERTHRWAKESIDAHKKETRRHGYDQFLFGIIQGGVHRDLRIESAEAICAMDFDGIAIGGESVGYNMPVTREILQWVAPYLPENKPHYTMGVGYSPMDLFDVVEHGIDMFDCVAPTRVARNGTLFDRGAKDSNFRISITNAKYREDFSPIDPTNTLPPHLNVTRAYLHHLFKAEELAAYRIATMHNLTFLLTLMKQMRAAIIEDRFFEFKKSWIK